MNKEQCNLSAIVITKNEEQRIAQCLESLSFCDEIIVVDNGSTDRTVEIAKHCHAYVYQHTEKNFSTLRNFGKEHAKGKWILYVDADEQISKKLGQEIQRIIEEHEQRKDQVTAYYISRENYYLGKKWPVRDRMQRLFIKEHLISWEGVLHETARYVGYTSELNEPLIHNTHRTLEEMVHKTNEWSNFEAQLRFEAHHPKVVWWRLIRVMLTGFFRSFIKEGGWKAGTVGWIESIYQGFSMFITYAKLWELQETRDRHT